MEKDSGLVQNFSKAHISILSPYEVVPVEQSGTVAAFLTGNWPTRTSMKWLRNPQQCVFGDKDNATSMLLRSLLNGNPVVVANVTPTKEDDGMNFGKPSSGTVATFLQPYKKLVSSVAKKLYTFVAACPNSGKIIAMVLKELSNEFLDLRSHGEIAGAQLFWQKGEDEAEERLWVLVFPDIHCGQRLYQKVPRVKALEGAKKDVVIFKLVKGAGNIGLHVDGNAYMKMVDDARRSINKALFNGEAIAAASAKFKASIELSEAEKRVLKKHRIDSQSGGTASGTRMPTLALSMDCLVLCRRSHLLSYALLCHFDF